MAIEVVTVQNANSEYVVSGGALVSGKTLNYGGTVAIQMSGLPYSDSQDMIPASDVVVKSSSGKVIPVTSFSGISAAGHGALGFDIPLWTADTPLIEVWYKGAALGTATIPKLQLPILLAHIETLTAGGASGTDRNIITNGGVPAGTVHPGEKVQATLIGPFVGNAPMVPVDPADWKFYAGGVLTATPADLTGAVLAPTSRALLIFTAPQAGPVTFEYQGHRFQGSAPVEQPIATGVQEGAPATFTGPTGFRPPANLTELNAIHPTPSTAWAPANHAMVGGQKYTWDGHNWVGWTGSSLYVVRGQAVHSATEVHVVRGGKLVKASEVHVVKGGQLRRVL